MVGLFASRRNPESGFGHLLLIAGAGWVFVSLATSDVAALYSLGRVAAWPEEALLVYLFLSYPAARPTTRPAWAVVGLAAGAVILIYLPTALVVGSVPHTVAVRDLHR